MAANKENLMDTLRDNQGLTAGAAAALVAHHKGMSLIEAALIGFGVMKVVEGRRADKAKKSLASAPHGMEARQTKPILVTPAKEPVKAAK